MKISSINNSNNPNKKRNVSFEQLYRVKIKHGVLGNSENVEDIIEAFNKDFNANFNILKGQFFELLSFVKPRKQKKLIKTFQKKYIMVPSFEKPSFINFKRLQEINEYGFEWLPNHLKVEIPRPSSSEHHTFTFFTGNDGFELAKTLSGKSYKKVRKQILKNAYKICDNEKYGKEDLINWIATLTAEKVEKIVKKISKNKIIEVENINNPQDWTDFVNKFFPSISR